MLQKLVSEFAEMAKVVTGLWRGKGSCFNPMKLSLPRLKYGLPVMAILAISLFAGGSSPAFAFLKFPFDPGAEWTICQGNNVRPRDASELAQNPSISRLDHIGDVAGCKAPGAGYSGCTGKYSFDFVIEATAVEDPLNPRKIGCNIDYVPNSDSFGQAIYSPGNGKISIFSGGEFLCIDLDNPEGDIHAVHIGHIDPDGSWKGGEVVTAGQLIGKLGKPSPGWGPPHIHISAWAGSCADKGTNLPFGNAFPGYSFPPLYESDGTTLTLNGYRGTKVKALGVGYVKPTGEPTNGNFLISGSGLGASGKIEICVPQKTQTSVVNNCSVLPASNVSWRDESISINIFNNQTLTINTFDRPITLIVTPDSQNSLKPLNIPFNDVDSSDDLSCYIVNAWKKGLISGKGSGNYDPKGDVTRAEFVKMAVRAKGMLVFPALSSPYDDVPLNHSMSGYIDAAKFSSEKAIHLLEDSHCYPFATTPNCFHPDQPILRAEAASVMAKLFRFPPASTLRDWWDVGLSGDFVKYYLDIQAVGAAYGNCGCNGPEPVMSGYPKGDAYRAGFGVANTLTRAEAAKLISLAMPPDAGVLK